MEDVFSIRSSSLPSGARVLAFRGHEGVSRLFAFEVFFSLAAADAEDLDMSDAMNAKASLIVHRKDDRDPFAFHGIISSLELVRTWEGRHLFRLTLVPRLWLLTQTFHSRMFTKLAVPDILKWVLEDGGLTSDDYDFRIQGSYAVEEHICEYRESHFDFFSRWLEREGMYYYFEHGDSDAKLVITDSKSSLEKGPKKAIRYYPAPGGDESSGERFSLFTALMSSLPGSVRVKDYDYGNPTLDVTGQAAVAPKGTGEINVYGARFFTPDDGKRVAKLRAEELLAKKEIFHAEGDALYVRSGYSFEIEEHPRPSYNAAYLATRVEHWGNQGNADDFKRHFGESFDGLYRVQVTAIPAKTQYRAPSETPWPRIYGFENGVVDGEADSEYAQIDDQGRYLVRFKFDESDLKDGKASTRVRMMQPHGGGIEGWHFPLRKGTEILFTFLGGDPDRPVISGVVPNAHTPSPVTSANHTTNVIQTGGRNRFELEDKHGQERVTLSTPHSNTYLRMGSPNQGHEAILHTDQNILVEADSGNIDIIAGGHLDERITGTVYEEYHDTKTEKVTGKYDVVYSNDVVDYVAQKKSETVQGAHEMYSWNTQKHEVGGALTQTWHGAVTRTIMNPYGSTQKATTRTIQGTLNDTVTEQVTLDYGPTTQTVKGLYDLKVNGTSQVAFSGPHQVFAWDFHANFNGGTKTDTYIGLANSNFVGGQLNITIAAQLSFSLALALTAKMGASVNVNASVDVNLTSSKIETGYAKFRQLPAVLRMCATNIDMAGSFVVT